MRKNVTFAIGLAVVATTTALSVATTSAAASTEANPANPTATTTSKNMYGIYESVAGYYGPPQWDGIASTGQHPNVANYYSGWDEGFDTDFANTAFSHGAEVFVEMEPINDGSLKTSACSNESGVPSMAAIAKGSFDTYLHKFAASIKAFNHPVLVTFAHEMNGNGWEPWNEQGCEHTTPAQWKAAWNHVRDVVKAGAANANFMWVPNVDPGMIPLSDYWPGESNVDSVGIDGYPARDRDIDPTHPQTFNDVFGSSFKEIKGLTPKKIFIAETNFGREQNLNITQFVRDALADGADGVLEYQEPNKKDPELGMTAQKWHQLSTALGY